VSVGQEVCGTRDRMPLRARGGAQAGANSQLDRIGLQGDRLPALGLFLPQQVVGNFQTVGQKSLKISRMDRKTPSSLRIVLPSCGQRALVALVCQKILRFSVLRSQSPTFFRYKPYKPCFLSLYRIASKIKAGHSGKGDWMNGSWAVSAGQRERISNQELSIKNWGHNPQSTPF
jgi:hypothetical protein